LTKFNANTQNLKNPDAEDLRLQLQLPDATQTGFVRILLKTKSTDVKRFFIFIKKTRVQRFLFLESFFIF